MPKSAVRLINNSKNKLNSEIIFIFRQHPNTRSQAILFACQQIKVDLGILWFVSLNNNFQCLNTKNCCS